MSILETDIKYLKSVGEKRAKILNNELEIFNFRDLLYHFPYKYIDKTKFDKINEIDYKSKSVQIKGVISHFEIYENNFKKRFVAKLKDKTGKIELIWFKNFYWLENFLEIDKEFIVFGKPNIFRDKVNLVHPEIEKVNKEKKINTFLVPEYSTTEKMKKKFISSKIVQKLQKFVFIKSYEKIEENLPEHLIEKLNLMRRKKSLLHIHFPKNQDFLKAARFRLKFEELFFIQLEILFKKNIFLEKNVGYKFTKVGKYFNNFYKKNLPFELTNAQKKVTKEIRRDCFGHKQMNRLLQGDVGSGKTIVALMIILIALDNDFQACIVAPTEILAKQHFAKFQEMLKGLGINVDILTGSTKQKYRKFLHSNLKDGTLQILIGTHAIMEDIVEFQNLGIVIIDEQHRFGVAQRAKLWKKNFSPPHILVMTATPIPRTLAMTVYGDLDFSIIDEMPPNRKEIKTFHRYDNQRLRVFKFIHEEIKRGRQIYIVYPLITESEHFDYKDLEDGYESIVRAFPSPKYTVGVAHGKMKAEEKEKSMQLFVKGISQILIATTVIEVGVDVPNASVMIIESAERFGLSQLHQLRGRVGRGADQSYCILMTSFKLTNDAKKRLKIMTETNDGFKIAEEDLKVRGSGNLDGTEQSGLPFQLKISNLREDGEILERARKEAKIILETDKNLENQENEILLEYLKKEEKNKKTQWGKIS